MRVVKCPKCGEEKMYRHVIENVQIEMCFFCGYKKYTDIEDDIPVVCVNNSDIDVRQERDTDSRNMCTDYEGKCGNCHKNLGNEDEYCRYCGTKRGEGAFKPYHNVSYCLYGPAPRLRVHSCPSCNYEWRTHSMVANEKHCPKCGERCEIVEQPEDY